MIEFVDDILNRITMYRLVLYYLIGLLVAALGLSIMKVLPYDPASLLLSVLLLVAVCGITNSIFASIFKVPANVESAYISALILALIITPAATTHDLFFLLWAAIWAMASKYILAINGKHLFNPAAFAVALTAISISQTASWWVGNVPMLPFVVVGGLLVLRKIRRFDMVWSFLLSAAAATFVLSLLNGAALAATFESLILYSPLMFFGFIILTEPLTAPHTNRLQVYYGVLVGVLSVPELHFGGFYLTPELAILFGNVFAYIVSPKAKMVLRLKDKIKIAPDVYDFVFTPRKKLAFAPGQYMEWTLGHDNPDSRGNRRYFTLASSPTEENLILGVKFYPKASSFKRSMLAMDRQSDIVAAQLAGDFVLPEDPNQKCVFIAGGIGITPFRSMVKYLLDKRQKRPIVLFYANKTPSEIVYQDVFDEAQQKLGLKVIYTLTGRSRIPANWKGQVGRITPQMIQEAVPDYRHCLFYLSGPNAMIADFEETLNRMGVKREHIKKDFFPGFA
jgi:ferredoxin-NADP reductase/Na+-translocating ferredoxin:NAD+ oxidoreductase RnfD subunit